jgi:hypothetical protein
MEKLSEIQALIDQNPNILQMLKEQNKEMKKKKKLEPGQVIEVPFVAEKEKEPTPIPMYLAKKMMKTTRKPRVLSEESRAKMLANLQKGREALQHKKKIISEMVTKKEQPAPVPTAKYVVQAPKPKKRKEEQDYITDIAQHEEMLKRLEYMQKQLGQSNSNRPRGAVQPPKKSKYSLFF